MLKTFKNQEVYFGDAGATLYLKEKLGEREFKKTLFVTGKTSFSRSGAERFLVEAGAEIHFRFSEFESNPTCSDLLEGLSLFETVQPDCIIAIGGGSVLDMAKLINFFGVSKISPQEYLQGAIQPEPDYSLLPCIAIPTTAGTGSEATHFSVLYKDHVKYSVADVRMVPYTVILCPALTEGMSPYQTACTGMDALAQGIESYWAVGATVESREYAKKAVQLAWSHLEKAVENPDIEDREKMQEAAYWSGRAIDISKTTLCHALSYSLTSHFGYVHGHAVALLLPAVFELHLKHGIISEELLGCFGCQNGQEILDQLSAMVKRIGMIPMNTFTLGDIALIASQVNLERMKNNPLIASRDVIHALLTAALVETKDNH